MAHLRNGESSRQDFSIFIDRLSIMLVEEATKYLSMPANPIKASADIGVNETSLDAKVLKLHTFHISC
jgi:uracil phosphoribosyltransferase